VQNEDYEHFLEGIFDIQGRDFVDAGIVSSQIKKGLQSKGIPEHIIRRVAVITFEAEVNIISYAQQGTISYYVLDDSIIIEADDYGPGIDDIELALQEGYSTADDSIREMGFGAGMGLSNIKKSSDEFEILSEPGTGTRLRSVIRLNGKTQGEEE
jgi:anti-sigma regulatory factor (Ser/Thr protein kinase)